MELRAQLAAHEADLLQLKKKWEKIVAKGNGARSGVRLAHLFDVINAELFI